MTAQPRVVRHITIEDRDGGCSVSVSAEVTVWEVTRTVGICKDVFVPGEGLEPAFENIQDQPLAHDDIVNLFHEQGAEKHSAREKALRIAAE